jgi:protein SCO1/2
MQRTVLTRLGRRLGSALALAFMLAAGAAAAPGSAYPLGLEFVDDHGATRALSEWRGRPLVIAMAYGACRSICSTTLRTLEAAQALADRKGIALAFVVVSIDPAEDTPQAWSDYRKARHLERANWTFLSGSKIATRTLARFLGVRFWSYDEHVMHDFKILRLDADGAIETTLDWNQRQLDALL